MAKYTDSTAIVSFYSFVEIPNKEILQPKIILMCKRKYLKGTVLLADEGFNGTLSGDEDKVIEVINEIVRLTGAKDLMIKTNYAPSHPFAKLKIRLKKEIVTIGINNLDVNRLKGEYISPEEWDKYLLNENTVLIDTRNDYEVSIGTFKGAVDPITASFRDFPKWVEDNKEKLEGKDLLMCCTGGIRCEKSTAYLKSVGFDNVYHLKGGILQYLEDTGNKNKMWEGECFVFDERIAVDENLAPSCKEYSDKIKTLASCES